MTDDAARRPAAPLPHARLRRLHRPTFRVSFSSDKTEADWVEAGRQIFLGADHIHQRIYDPRLIAVARDKRALEELKVEPRPDGTLLDLLWVPTSQGLALSAPSCAGCHTYYSLSGNLAASIGENRLGVLSAVLIRD